MLFAVTPK